MLTGVTVIDADIIARQVVEPGTPALLAIAERFGPQMINDDGSLNRRRLRERILLIARTRRLNALLHPLIQQETRRQMQSSTSPYLLWVVPLLVENRLTDKADRILVVDVPKETQIERTIRRDGVSREHAEHILAARRRANSVLPQRMMLLKTWAPRMPSHPTSPACTISI